jgi:hypothetical protein
MEHEGIGQGIQGSRIGAKGPPILADGATTFVPDAALALLPGAQRIYPGRKGAAAFEEVVDGVGGKDLDITI